MNNPFDVPLIDLEVKCNDLKTFVSQFESIRFLGEVSSLMQFIRFKNPSPALEGLSSPQRQLFYLAALNITSAPNSNLLPSFNNEQFNLIKNLLNEIEQGYMQLFYPTKKEDFSNDDWKQKVLVSMSSFLSFFNQGLMNYEEQIIQRIISYFTPFENSIINEFGLSVQDFIDIYNHIDAIPNTFLSNNIHHKDTDISWEQFCEEMKQKNIPSSEWNKHLPENHRNFSNFLSDKGQLQRIYKNDLVQKFGQSKADSFLTNFVIKRGESKYLYFTENNPLFLKPIFQIDENTFQAIDMQHIIQAVYNSLATFCINDEKLREKFYSIRGDKLELKVAEIFKRFFGKEAIVYHGYYTQDKHEQDLLIIFRKFAFIVEVKASKRNEPRREPKKAYPLILSNFNETIQKGYDQAYRVKGKFIAREIIEIYSDEKLSNKIAEINTKRFHQHFSIIVTQERFGPIQTNLYDLLEKMEDDEYPWSICIDDLEVFFLQLERMKKTPFNLCQFLNLRQQLHGHLIADDELGVCGGFLNQKITFSKAESDEILMLAPDMSEVFDKSYEEGIGFVNEKNLAIKKSGKYHFMGGFNGKR